MFGVLKGPLCTVRRERGRRGRERVGPVWQRGIMEI